MTQFKITHLPNDPALSYWAARRRTLLTVRPVAPKKNFEPTAPSAVVPTVLHSRRTPPVAKSEQEQPTNEVLGPNATYKDFAVFPAFMTAHGFALDPAIFPWLTDRAAAYNAYALVTVRAFDEPVFRDAETFKQAVRAEYDRITAYDVRDASVASRHHQYLQRHVELKGWLTRQDEPVVFFAAYSTGKTMTKKGRQALREILYGIRPTDRAQEQRHLRAKRRYEATTPEERIQMMHEALARLDDTTGTTDALWDAFIATRNDHESRIARLERALGATTGSRTGPDHTPKEAKSDA